MGFRVDLTIQDASFIANLLSKGGSLPNVSLLEDDESLPNRQRRFRRWVKSMETSFMSSPQIEMEWRRAIRDLVEDLAHGPLDLRRISADRAFRHLRDRLSERPWTALIVPSGRDDDIDEHICSFEFLRTNVDIACDTPGLILQIQPPEDQLVISNIFPSFRTALAAANQWPGILIWLESGDSAFFPISNQPEEADRRSHWLFSHLATGYRPDLEQLARLYDREFQVSSAARSEVTLIHLSDLHIGSKEASLRLSRLPQMLENIVSERGDRKNYAIAITGDLVDTPSEENLDKLRLFLQAIAPIADNQIMTCWGNHDVRSDGIGREDYRVAMRIPPAGGNFHKLCDGKLAIVAFNSVTDGKLARGKVGERQLLDIGTQIDRELQDTTHLLGLIHHHPTPVEVPTWYKRPFYERWLRGKFERTDELEDAASFMQFVKARGFACVLHGHKHIPRIDMTNRDVPIYGCGSSVGKVATTDGQPYSSINLVTYNPETDALSARLLAERVPGGGLVESNRAEILSIPRRPARIRRA